ncbi:ACPP isoform 9, partial [Pan troglodytes]
ELYFEKGEYFVEMYYRNETQHEPYPLMLPGCSPSCPLERFAELVGPVIPQDWSTECMTTNSHQGPAETAHSARRNHVIALPCGRSTCLENTVLYYHYG